MPVDRSRLAHTIEYLAAFDRPSASDGEKEAALWIADQLRAQGWHARVEVEQAHGGYWWPLGLLTFAGGLAALGGRRARGASTALGLLAAAGIADDVSGGPHLLRRALPTRDTFNVVAEAGDPAAERTIVVVGHHDAAHGGLVFGSGLLEWFADSFPSLWAKQETLPQIMRIVTAGPLLAALGAATGSRRLRRLGGGLSFGSTLAFADIGSRHVVPGANDNLSGTACVIELGRLLAEDPVSGVKVVLVSTGSEESFMEGMRGFMRRHGGTLAPATTEVLVIDSVGSPELVLIEGEGMLVMEDYDPQLRNRLAAAAAALELPIRRGLRLGFATDALIAMRAGYRAACLGSCSKYKLPSNYHKQTDTFANVRMETVEAAARITEGVVRSLAAEAA